MSICTKEVQVVSAKYNGQCYTQPPQCQLLSTRLPLAGGIFSATCWCLRGSGGVDNKLTRCKPQPAASACIFARRGERRAARELGSRAELFSTENVLGLEFAAPGPVRSRVFGEHSSDTVVDSASCSMAASKHFLGFHGGAWVSRFENLKATLGYGPGSLWTDASAL